MNKSMLLTALIIISHSLSVAQQVDPDSVTVTFQVVVPANTPYNDTIFWAGTLNSWDPGVDGSGFSARDLSQSATKANGIWSVQLKSTRGDTVRYKYTRGSIFSVEEAVDYTYRKPRTVIFDSDKIIRDTVGAWHDIPPEALQQQWPVVELEPVDDLIISYKGRRMKGTAPMLNDQKKLTRFYKSGHLHTEVTGVPEMLQRHVSYFVKVSEAPDNTILIIAGQTAGNDSWNIYVDRNNDNRISGNEFIFTTFDSLKRQAHTTDVRFQDLINGKMVNKQVPLTITKVTDIPAVYQSSVVPDAPDLTYQLPFKNRTGRVNNQTFYLNTNFGSSFIDFHQVLLDYNQDDTLEIGSGSPERAEIDLGQMHRRQSYYIHPTFTLGDHTWEVADVDREGEWIRLRPSRKSVNQQAITVDKPAPEWNATALDGSVIGSEVLRGQYVLLDFWGSWCGPCIQAIPLLKEAYERFKSENFTIIGFAYENEASLHWALEQYELPWPQILDDEGEYGTRFLVSGYPTHYLVSPDGTVLAMGRDLRGEQLIKTLEKYLQ